MLRDKLHWLYQRPQNVLCMSDDICASVDVEMQKWCYFKVQWHSLGQHKMAFYCLDLLRTYSLAPWPATQSFHLQVPLSCVLSRLWREKKSGALQKRPGICLQVGMSSHKALSVSDLMTNLSHPAALGPPPPPVERAVLSGAGLTGRDTMAKNGLELRLLGG